MGLHPPRLYSCSTVPTGSHWRAERGDAVTRLARKTTIEATAKIDMLTNHSLCMRYQPKGKGSWTDIPGRSKSWYLEKIFNTGCSLCWRETRLLSIPESKYHLNTPLCTSNAFGRLHRIPPAQIVQSQPRKFCFAFLRLHSPERLGGQAWRALANGPKSTDHRVAPRYTSYQPVPNQFCSFDNCF